MANSRTLFERRQRRVRYALRTRGNGRVRMSVFRSSKHIYAQLIDDANGVTLASASTLDKDLRAQCDKGCTVDAAKLVGAEIARRAKAAKVAEVVFDRGGYIYHGRIKALADAAREAGLKF